MPQEQGSPSPSWKPAAALVASLWCIWPVTANVRCPSSEGSSSPDVEGKGSEVQGKSPSSGNQHPL